MNEEYPVNEYDSTGSFAVNEIQSNRQQALEYEEERKKQEALATEQTQQAEATQDDPRNADKWGIKAKHRAKWQPARGSGKSLRLQAQW